MPSIIYRRLDAEGEPVWGSGSQSFLGDLDAVAQAILTRLRLFEGEWWADLGDGTPYFQNILGVSLGRDFSAVSLLIQQRILGTPFVTGLSDVQVTFDSNNRQFKFQCNVQTAFGKIALTNIPRPPGVDLP